MAHSRPAATPGSARDPSPEPRSIPESDDERLFDVAERVGSALQAGGLPRLPSRVLAALLAHDEGRMGAGDLARVLHISPASVSSAVGYLDRLRLIRREREPGSRRDSYVVMDDAWHDLMLQTDQIYLPIIAAFAYGVEASGPDTRAGARLQLQVDFLEFIRTETNSLVARWEQRRRELLEG